MPICEVCGQVYNQTKEWKSNHTCCHACYIIRKNRLNREYSRIRSEEERNKTKKIVRDKMAEVNEMARARGISYGQMQGIIYCLDHPMINLHTNRIERKH